MEKVENRSQSVDQMRESGSRDRRIDQMEESGSRDQRVESSRRSRDMFASTAASTVDHKENLSMANILKRPAAAPRSPVQAFSPAHPASMAATEKERNGKKRRGESSASSLYDTFSVNAVMSSDTCDRSKNRIPASLQDEEDLFGFGPADDEPQKSANSSRVPVISQEEEEEDIFGFQPIKSEQQTAPRKETAKCPVTYKKSSEISNAPAPQPVTSNNNTTMFDLTSTSCRPARGANISSDLNTTGFIGKVGQHFYLPTTRLTNTITL